MRLCDETPRSRIPRPSGGGGSIPRTGSQRAASTRALAKTLGGVMEPAEKEWSYNRVVICDAVDPEGNVIQFREIA